MSGVPVLCPKCNLKSLVIRTGDKLYCLNPECNYGYRLPTDHKYECESNVKQYRYYVRQLELEVLESRGVDPVQFRNGFVTGMSKELEEKLGRTSNHLSSVSRCTICPHRWQRRRANLDKLSEDIVNLIVKFNQTCSCYHEIVEVTDVKFTPGKTAQQSGMKFRPTVKIDIAIKGRNQDK